MSCLLWSGDQTSCKGCLVVISALSNVSYSHNSALDFTSRNPVFLLRGVSGEGGDSLNVLGWRSDDDPFVGDGGGVVGVVVIVAVVVDAGVEGGDDAGVSIGAVALLVLLVLVLTMILRRRGETSLLPFLRLVVVVVVVM